jgi:Ca-activated chloride channel homolog
MIPSDLTYGVPIAAFLGIVLLPILLFQWGLHLYRLRVLGELGQSEVIREIVVPRSQTIFWAKTVLLLLIWLGVVLALMQPEGNAHYIEEKFLKKKNSEQDTLHMRKKAHDVILLMDASASMGVPDSRHETTRFDFAKDIADQIVSLLEGENVALQAFTSETAQLAPLTMDYLFVRLMIRQMQINEGNVPGTDLLAALKNAAKEYFQQPSSKLRSLILLSDGGDTQLESSNGREEEILNTINNAEELNLRVFTVGMGSKKGGIVPGVTYQGHSVDSSLEEELLQKLARRGRGSYYDANSMSSVEIASEIIKEMKRDPPYFEEGSFLKGMSGGKNKLFDQYFQIPLAIAIVLLMGVILYPDSLLDSKKKVLG